MTIDLWLLVAYPLTKVPSPAWHNPRQPHKMSVKRHEDGPTFLLVYSSNHGFYDIMRSEAGCDKLVPPRLRELDSTEQWGHNVTWAKQGGADSWGVVDMVKLVAE